MKPLELIIGCNSFCYFSRTGRKTKTHGPININWLLQFGHYRRKTMKIKLLGEVAESAQAVFSVSETQQFLV